MFVMNTRLQPLLTGDLNLPHNAVAETTLIKKANFLSAPDDFIRWFVRG